MHRDSKMASTLVTILALAALPLAACKKPAGEGPGGGAPVALTAESAAPVRVTLATAQARQVPDVLSATGTLVPDQQSQVTALVPGRVTAVLVERGAQVREGDAMLRLRDTDYRANAATATAAVGQARARLGLDGTSGRFDPEAAAEVRAAAAQRDIADDGLRRAEQLHTSGSMSDAEYQRVLLQATAAREQHRSAVNGTRASYFAYQQAREVLATAQRSVADSVVRAPFSGEVAERTANVGEYVTAQRAVVTLVKIDPLRMEIQIPQERFAQVRPDQAVEVRVDAWPDRVFRGTLRYISAAVRTDTRALVAEAVIPNAERVLRPGLFATARIALGTQRAAVAIPARAVLSEAGTSRVFVVVNGRAQARVVSVLERQGDDVLIERGIAPGERLATDNLPRLGDGVAVTDHQ
jgi:membrane fusion protein (multidrug efflux system)